MATKRFKKKSTGIVAGIFVAVIGGLILNSILPVLPRLRNSIETVLLWIGGIPSWIWCALISDYTVPGWLGLIVGLLSLIGCLLLWTGLRPLIQQTTEPEYKGYTEDVIDGVKWRWSWDGNRISNKFPFCPCCDAQLVYGDGYTHTAFICERCPSDGSLSFHDGRLGRVVATIHGGSQTYALEAVEREIQRRVRIRYHLGQSTD